MGIFNVSSRPLTELISLSSFPGIVPGYYVVRAHTTGKVSQPTTLEGPGSLFTASLPIRGYEIFSAFCLTPLSSSKHGEVYVSNLGLLGKMTGVAAVIMNDIKQELQNSRVALVTRIKAFGKLGKSDWSCLTSVMVSRLS